jgi:hypothetical protein
VEELRKQGLIDDNPSDDAPPSEECVQALKEIDNERAASDRALRRGEAGPVDLKQSYEQDMYYADKRIKTIDRVCRADGKSRSHDFGRWLALQTLSINRKGCAIIAKDCKPRKHW